MCSGHLRRRQESLMHIRGRWTLLGLGVLLLVAGACASDDNDGSSVDPGATPAVTSESGGAGSGGAAGAGGSSTLNCGEEQQGHGTGYDRAARECLWQAYQAGGGAVFTTTRPTIEGDPIVWHINVVSSDIIEVTIDNTADQFAAADDRKVATVTCTAMAITDDGRNDLAFELTGCGDHRDTIVV
jgi:hypothetical protein